MVPALFSYVNENLRGIFAALQIDFEIRSVLYLPH